MLRNVFCGVLFGMAVAGCSSMQTAKEEPDDSPMSSTAVLETHLVSDGFKGFAPFEGTTKSYTRANMQRSDTALKGTGSVTRFFIGTNMNARIERLDRKLVWTLDAKDKTYIECPLMGCTGPLMEKPQEKKPEKPEKPHEPECRMKIANATFTVKPTGQKKSINGFDTEQYQAAWVITLQDPSARKTISTLNVDLWTTPMTPPLKEALAVEQTYARALAGILVGKMTNIDKTQVVPAQAAKMIDTYLSQLLGPADKAAFLNSGKQMDKIKGYPVLTQLTWNLQGNACADKDSASSSSGTSSTPKSSGDLLSSVTDFFAKKKTDETAKDIADKPIFSFSSEVKSHRIEPVHDGMFAPPKSYKLANPK